MKLGHFGEHVRMDLGILAERLRERSSSTAELGKVSNQGSRIGIPGVLSQNFTGRLGRCGEIRSNQAGNRQVAGFNRSRLGELLKFGRRERGC